MKVEICGDIMFSKLNFEIMFFTLVSSIMSTRKIVDTIQPLTTGIIVDLYISC